MYFVYIDVAVVAAIDVAAVAAVVVTNWMKNLLEPFAQLWMSGKACSD